MKTNVAAALAVFLCGMFVPAERLAAAELIMFDSTSCSVCRKLNRDVAPGYRRSASAKVFPLRNIDINSGKIDVQLARPPIMTPTFVFVDEGREIARFVGFPGKDYFYRIVEAAAEELQKINAAAPAN